MPPEHTAFEFLYLFSIPHYVIPPDGFCTAQLERGHAHSDGRLPRRKIPQSGGQSGAAVTKAQTSTTYGGHRIN